MVDGDNEGDGGLDTELDTTASDDDDDRNLGATSSPDLNDNRICVAAVPAEPVTNNQARGEATDSASSGSQSLILNDRASNPMSSTEWNWPSPSMNQQRDRSPSAEDPTQSTSYTKAPAAAGRIHDVFVEYEKRFRHGFTDTKF